VESRATLEKLDLRSKKEYTKIMQIDLTVLGTAMAVIIGLVNGISLIGPKINSFAKFGISLGLGLLFGYFHTFGLNLESGIVVALASSGLYKLTQNLGTIKTEP
jgi:hypothetical protein